METKLALQQSQKKSWTRLSLAFISSLLTIHGKPLACNKFNITLRKTCKTTHKESWNTPRDSTQGQDELSCQPGQFQQTTRATRKLLTTLPLGTPFQKTKHISFIGPELETENLAYTYAGILLGKPVLPFKNCSNSIFQKASWCMAHMPDIVKKRNKGSHSKKSWHVQCRQMVQQANLVQISKAGHRDAVQEILFERLGTPHEQLEEAHCSHHITQDVDSFWWDYYKPTHFPIWY